MIVAESMICGTPCIAFNKGSMPELIEQGKTGFLVENVEEAVEALDGIKHIERSFCRTWAGDKFSREKMAADYMEIYRKILKLSS